MKTRIRSLAFMGGLLLLLAVATLLFASPALADLPPTNACETIGSTTTCDLWATTGTLTMPDGEIVPTWGFTSTAGVSATVPGPLLFGTQGETMVVTLHNELPGEMVALAFPGQELLPDLDGVAEHETVAYTFTLTNPGTFLYEAGLTAGGPRQVAMGLYGALVVQPITPTQAYTDAGTAFDHEELLVLSEIDPVFHSDPGAFALHEYAPRYWLINGQAYSDVPEIDVVPGEKLLLRYVNAGIETHWPGLLGLQQQRIASDGQRLPASYGAVVQTLAAGQTVDSLATIPLTAVQDQRFALYDTSLLLHNANQRRTSGDLAYGGMMTFLHAVTDTLPSPAGPVPTLVQVGDSPTDGNDPVTLRAEFASGVTAAEFFTNTVGLTETGTTMAPAGNTATYDFLAGDLSNWPSGFITFYVRGFDGTDWGPVGSAVLNLDMLGPVISGMSLEPEPSNGSQPVLLRATGDDHNTGRNNVISATYTIDGGPPVTMALARTDNPITAMTATLTITTIAGLAEGERLIAITAEDSLGNITDPTGFITLTLDQTGPEEAVVTLDRSLLKLSVPLTVTHVRLDATITDAPSNGAQSLLANAEGFIDTVGPDGSGFDLFPSDGLFDDTTEDAYFEIPIASFLYLAQGDHLVHVHGLDSAGNWGPPGSATITIDRDAIDTEGPTINVVDVTPNPTGGAVLIDVAAAASDPGLLSNIAQAEWFVDTDPGEGNGSALSAADGAFDSPNEALAETIDVSGWSNDSYTFSVRAQDSSGFWGAAESVILEVDGNAFAVILADGFESGTFDAWTATAGAVSITPEAAMPPARSALGMEAVVAGDVPAYVSYVMPAGETVYLGSFWFDPNSTDMGTQEHDILVGLNGGTPIFGIQVEASTGGGYEVRGWALSAGAPSYTAWYDIADAPNKLGIGWQAGSPSSFDLSLGDAVLEQVGGLDTAAYTLHEIRLGPSANLDPAASGIEYFDEFEAERALQLYLPLVMRNQ